MSITPAGDGSGALAKLAIQKGPDAGAELAIPTPVVTVGRGGQNDLVIPDDSVSTTHARLEFQDGGWRITDLNSINGTFVESVKLAPQVPTPLPYGSTVRLGGTRLHFRAVERADPGAARAAYTPPPPQTTIRERRSGVRIPVWLVLLILLLIVLAVLVFGWLWAPGTVPTPAEVVLLLPPELLPAELASPP